MGSRGPKDLRLRSIMAAGHRLQRPTKGLANMSDRYRAEPVDVTRCASCGIDHRASGRPGRRDTLRHGGRRPDDPRECDLAHERRSCRGATPVAAEASAAAMARSHAGSSRRTPPDDAPNSSDRPSGRPAPRSRRPPPVGTDEDRGPSPGAWVARRWPRRAPAPPRRAPGDPPEARRWPHPRRGTATRAVRSGRSRAAPRPPSRTTPSRPRRRIGSCHPKDPQARTWIAVERQDDVDGVLERPRTGQVAVLRHVAGEQHRDAFLLGQPDERVGAHADLGRTTGHLGARRVAEGLDGIDSEQERPGLTRGLDHVREVAAGRERDGVARHTEPPGTCGHLRVGFLTRHQHARLTGCGQVRQHVKQERGLADPRLAREQRHGRRNDAATEHAIDARDAGGDAPLVVGSGGQRAELVHCAGARCRPTGGPHLVDGAPLAAAGATSDPLRHLLATRRAREDRSDLRHVRNVSIGSDIACHDPILRLSSLSGCTLHTGR